MWLGIKFEMWGFIFGAAALVLAFPLSLLANLATPHLGTRGQTGRSLD
jgi:hypothetical protein